MEHWKEDTTVGRKKTRRGLGFKAEADERTGGRGGLGVNKVIICKFPFGFQTGDKEQERGAK